MMSVSALSNPVLGVPNISREVKLFCMFMKSAKSGKY